jgi:hypothetical protein
MERRDQHRLSPPFEAMGVVADAISTLLHADPQTSVRAALGDLETLREAVDCLDMYQQFQPVVMVMEPPNFRDGNHLTSISSEDGARLRHCQHTEYGVAHEARR